MPRVTWLFEYPTLNGGERSLLATLPAVRAAGYLVSAIAPAAGPLAEALAAEEIAVAPLAFRGADGTRRPLETLRTELASRIADCRPDILHANSLSMGRLAAPVARAAGVRSIAHLRDIINLKRRAIADLNEADRLLAVSAATRDHHVAAGLSPEKTHVLHNGVDLDSFHPRPRDGWLGRELGLPADTQLVATIGQVVLRKGHDVLIRAAETVATKMGNVHFLIVGQRYSIKREALDYENQLRDACGRGPLAGRVHFLGERTDVARLLNEVDALVHPARQEPLGRVLLEAAAAGTPVIATDVGGTREIFPDDAHAARIVPPDDDAAIARELSNLLTDPDARRSLGENARLRAETAFDIRLATEGLVRHYLEVSAPA